MQLQASDQPKFPHRSLYDGDFNLLKLTGDRITTVLTRIAWLHEQTLIAWHFFNLQRTQPASIPATGTLALTQTLLFPALLWKTPTEHVMEKFPRSQHGPHSVFHLGLPFQFLESPIKHWNFCQDKLEPLHFLIN